MSGDSRTLSRIVIRTGESRKFPRIYGGVSAKTAERRAKRQYRLGVVLVSRRRGAGRQAKLRESRRHNPSVKETA